MTGEADANAPAGQNSDRPLMLTVRNVAALNRGYFGIEFAVAIAIGSVALFADSVDFLEDGAVKYSDHCRAWIFGGEARQTRYAALNTGAAHEVYLAARAEHVAAKP